MRLFNSFLSSAPSADGCTPITPTSPLKNGITTDSPVEHPCLGPPSRVATAGEALPARRDYFFSGPLRPRVSLFVGLLELRRRQMRVDLRRADRTMPQKFLHAPQVRTVIQHVSREAVP